MACFVSNCLGLDGLSMSCHKEKTNEKDQKENPINIINVSVMSKIFIIILVTSLQQHQRYFSKKKTYLNEWQ